jgi:predicted tellurium resistance membrane protein TerC
MRIFLIILCASALILVGLGTQPVALGYGLLFLMIFVGMEILVEKLRPKP